LDACFAFNTKAGETFFSKKNPNIDVLIVYFHDVGDNAKTKMRQMIQY
jgi:hypothetical protein